MPRETSSEAWRKMVLRSMPPPAWLQHDSPDSDVVISSRHRIARNLVGHRFTTTADPEELREIAAKVKAAVNASALQLEQMARLTEAERDYLLGCRLISPDFRHKEPGRVIWLDRDRRLSMMVNEEDHIRLQAVTGGWSPWNSEEAARHALRQLRSGLEFAEQPQLGFLTASPTNLGRAERRSALFHLIGLGTQGNLPRMLKSLGLMGFVARGIFGEASRGVAAFIQVSAVSGTQEEFRGACSQLIEEERQARRSVRRTEIEEKVGPAVDFATTSVEITLRDALLVLGMVRWAAAVGIKGFGIEPRQVDQWVSGMEVFGTQSPKVAARQRAEYLRARIENLT